MQNETKAVEKHHNLFFENLPVRIVLDENDEPWWLAKDVCDILELSNPSQAITILDEDELASLKVRSGGQAREMNAISESGLYTLIIRSNKPQAKPFRRWVTHEVLPSIRRTGQYLHAGQETVPADSRILVRFFERMERIERKVDQFLISSSVHGPAWSFVHKCCRVGQQYMTEKNELYAAYAAYCRAGGTHVETRSHFFMRLYRAVPTCYPSTRRRGGPKTYIVRGLGLIDRS